MIHVIKKGKDKIFEFAKESMCRIIFILSLWVCIVIVIPGFVLHGLLPG